MFLAHFGCSFEGNKLAHKILVNIHDGRIIVKIATIIFSREYSDELLIISKEAVAILHDLMAAAYQV